MKQTTQSDCGCKLTTDGADFTFAACGGPGCDVSGQMWDTDQGEARGIYYKIMDILEGA